MCSLHFCAKNGLNGQVTVFVRTEAVKEEWNGIPELRFRSLAWSSGSGLLPVGLGHVMFLCEAAVFPKRAATIPGLKQQVSGFLWTARDRTPRPVICAEGS